MAILVSPNYLCLFALLFLLLQLQLPTILSSHHHDHHKLKSLHFVLYEHDTLNKTTYLVVNGVAGAGPTPTTAPIGTLSVFQDPMTLTPSLTSEVVGTLEGAAVVSSLDGLETINAATVTLNHVNNHKGSITIVGVAHNVKSSDVPVVGGTGDFLFVQGYVTTSLVNVTEFINYVYKWEFNLYWPPYAAHDLKHSK